MLTVQKFSDRVKIVDKTNPNSCWLWTGTVKTNGYGRYQCRVDGKWVAEYAHRFSYQLFNRQIKADETVDHTCRNHQCCNPLHLEAVSNLENVRREHAALGHKVAR